MLIQLHKNNVYYCGQSIKLLSITDQKSQCIDVLSIWYRIKQVTGGEILPRGGGGLVWRTTHPSILNHLHNTGAETCVTNIRIYKRKIKICIWKGNYSDKP